MGWWGRGRGMGPRPISSRKQIRAQALTVQNGTDQWQGADWVSHGMRDDGDFLTLMEGGKPHLTKLFRCIGENLITFGHLNENRMWLEPIRPAVFKEQHLSCGPWAPALSHSPRGRLGKTPPGSSVGSSELQGWTSGGRKVEAGCRTPGSLGQLPSSVSSPEPC